MTRTRSPGQERDDDEAIDWLVRLHAPEAQEADWVAFTEWLDSYPGHRQAYDRVEALWADLDEHAPEIKAALEQPALSIVSSGAVRGPGPRPRLKPAWLVGPMIAAAGLTAFMIFETAPRPVPARGVVYQTAPGERRSVMLSDGSRLTLNGRSRISVDLSGRARQVALSSGSEVAFDVHHDATRPFLIAAGDRRVRVLGTEFVVERAGRRMVVSVRRGVVQVESADPRSGVHPARLARGEQLVHLDGATKDAIRYVRPDDAFAWMAGRRVYHDIPLGELVSDLNRGFAVPIQVDARAARLRFTGVLVVDSEDAVVRRLESFLPVRAERAPTAITLRVRGAGTGPSRP